MGRRDCAVSRRSAASLHPTPGASCTARTAPPTPTDKCAYRRAASTLPHAHTRTTCRAGARRRVLVRPIVHHPRARLAVGGGVGSARPVLALLESGKRQVEDIFIVLLEHGENVAARPAARHGERRPPAPPIAAALLSLHVDDRLQDAVVTAASQLEARAGEVLSQHAPQVLDSLVHLGRSMVDRALVARPLVLWPSGWRYHRAILPGW
eukprot:6222928-Prymnesium_polylepis.1